MNAELLKYFISKSGMNLQQFAELLGITYNSLYKKMVKVDGFSVGEIKVIAKTLSLTKNDVLDIFFDD